MRGNFAKSNLLPSLNKHGWTGPEGKEAPGLIWTWTRQPERLLRQLWCVSNGGAKPKCPTFGVNRAGIILEFSLYFTDALSAFLKQNNSELGYSRCLFFPPSRSLTHMYFTHFPHTHTQTNPCLSRHHFLFFVFFFLFFLSLSLSDMKLSTGSLEPSFQRFLYKHKVTRWLLSLHTDSSFRTRKNVKNV